MKEGSSTTAPLEEAQQEGTEEQEATDPDGGDSDTETKTETTTTVQDWRENIC